MEQARPQQTYKREFLDRVMGFAPKSLLDVGCGEAELLKAISAAGCDQCTGIELDDAAVANARQQGLDVRFARAESLPLADRSYDVVTLEYVAHHIEVLERALVEAARVARLAVLVLDPWYDLSVPSQRTASDFDNWLKIVDRRLGRVHNPCVAAARLAAPFVCLGGFRIDYSYRLFYRDVPLSKVEATARNQLATLGRCPHLESELLELLDRVRLHGMSDDGALGFCAQRES